MDGDEFERAKTVALNYLSHRARTERDVARRVEKAGFPPEVAAAVVEWARQFGFVDDAAFAAAWVRSRGDRRHSSLRLLRQELAQQGVPRDLVDDVLSQEDADSEQRRADALAEQVWGKLSRQGVADDVARRRTYAALGRRGFSGSTARDAVLRAAGDSER